MTKPLFIKITEAIQKIAKINFITTERLKNGQKL